MLHPHLCLLTLRNRPCRSSRSCGFLKFIVQVDLANVPKLPRIWEPLPVRRVRFAETVDRAEVGSPLSADPVPPIRGTTLVVDASPVVAELVQLAPVMEYAAPAPAVTHAAPAPVDEFDAPAPAVTHAAPAPVVECFTPALVETHEAPTPVEEDVAPAPADEFDAPAPAATWAASASVIEDTAPAPAVTGTEQPMMVPQGDDLLWQLYGSSAATAVLLFLKLSLTSKPGSASS